MKKRLLLGRDLCPKGPFEEDYETVMNANGGRVIGYLLMVIGYWLLVIGGRGRRGFLIF
jgi:hypothetical protein